MNIAPAAIAGAIAILLALPLRMGAQVPAPATVHVLVRTPAGPAAGVIVVSGDVASQTDARGEALLRLAPGTASVIVRRLGFAPDSARLELRAGTDTTITFLLHEQPTTIAPVVVSSTRVERRVEDEPLRVEVLAGEDVSEKTQMRPADLRLLLTEMSGVRVQTTSPALGAASVRIQGLRGRYTQILTDGLPLYGAQAGSFGLLQIPPLDLRQAEVIKGAASALYGPGASGGVLDLISRRPPDSSEVLLNQTGEGGSDLVGFGARELTPHIGITTLAGAHRQRAVDTDHDGWSDIPGFRRVEVRPRFFASDTSGGSMMLTLGAFAENRGGGASRASAIVPADSPASVGGIFPESLATRHVDAGGTVRARVGGRVTMVARFAGNVQQRMRRFGAQRELEHAGSASGEVTSTIASGAHTLLVGVAEQYERYRNGAASRFDDDRSTPAVFLQHTWSPNAWLATQVNGRCDASSVYGTICAPRLSVLAHSGSVLNVRLSGGAGWSAPQPLTEETEVIGLTRVVGPLRVAAERARTASLDVSSTQGPLEVSGTLFASRVKDPVGLRQLSGDPLNRVELVNAAGPAHAHGAELFAVFNEEPIIVTAYYSATRTRETSPQSGRVRESPYVPRETAGIDAAFEEDESGTRVGLEVFYTGRQALEDNPYRLVSPPYVTAGLLASQQVGRANVYVNFENLTNVRQSRFDPLLRPTPGEGGRLTVDEWAPLESRTVNAGVRLGL